MVEQKRKAIHTSDLISHQYCNRLFFFSNSHFGLGYKPKVPTTRTELGTWFHRALAGLYSGLDPVVEFGKAWEVTNQTLPEAVKPEFQTEAEFGVSLLNLYLDWAANNTTEYGDQNLIFLEVEKKFQLEHRGHLIGGTWDGTARFKDTGKLVVVEHKTSDNIVSLEAGLRWDFQPRIYAASAELIYGEEVEGVLYNLIEKRRNTDNVQLKLNGLPHKCSGPNYLAKKWQMG